MGLCAPMVSILVVPPRRNHDGVHRLAAAGPAHSAVRAEPQAAQGADGGGSLRAVLRRRRASTRGLGAWWSAVPREAAAAVVGVPPPLGRSRQEGLPQGSAAAARQHHPDRDIALGVPAAPQFALRLGPRSSRCVPDPADTGWFLQGTSARSGILHQPERANPHIS